MTYTMAVRQLKLLSMILINTKMYLFLLNRFSFISCWVKVAFYTIYVIHTIQHHVYHWMYLVIKKFTSLKQSRVILIIEFDN